MSEGFDRYPWLKTSSAEHGGADLRKAAQDALRELDLIQPQNMGAHVYRTREALRAALTTQHPPRRSRHDRP